MKFNVDGLLRGDYASRMQGYATARQNGWMSANDIRELEDMNMISEEEGGNLYLVNGSFTKLADAGAFANPKKREQNHCLCKIISIRVYQYIVHWHEWVAQTKP